MTSSTTLSDSSRQRELPSTDAGVSQWSKKKARLTVSTPTTSNASTTEAAAAGTTTPSTTTTGKRNSAARGRESSTESVGGRGARSASAANINRNGNDNDNENIESASSSKEPCNNSNNIIATKAHDRRLVLWGLKGYDWVDDENEDGGDDAAVTGDGAAEQKPQTPTQLQQGGVTTKEDRIADALGELSDLLVDEGSAHDGKAGGDDDNNGDGNILPVREAVDEYNASMFRLSILKGHPNHVRLLQEGFFFLTNWIHDNPNGARQAARCDLAKFAVDAMRRFPEVEELQLRALEALDNLHCNAAIAAKASFVKKLDGITCTVDAMKNYPDNFHLQDRAISLLAWICRVPELRSDVAKAKALGLVVKAVDTHVHVNNSAGAVDALPKNDLHRLAKEVAEHLVLFL